MLVKPNLYFIGAGPGDPELITLKGLKLLKEADIIIYAGSLVNRKLLDYAKDEAQIHNSAYLSCDEIIQIIEQGVQNQKAIVRLHTGDPSLYGAIHEQMYELDKINIPYKVIPGVSSAFGAAASLKAELTMPGITQTVIFTRAAGRTPIPGNESIKSLARIGCTLIIFLSTSMLKSIVQDLLNSKNYNNDTKIAVVYRATWKDEKIIKGTLRTICELVNKANITKQALIITGPGLDWEHTLKVVTTVYGPKLNEAVSE